MSNPADPETGSLETVRKQPLKVSVICRRLTTEGDMSNRGGEQGQFCGGGGWHATLCRSQA